MKEFSRYWSKGIFEDQNDVVVVKDAYKLVTAAGGANQSIIAAVTGKKLFIISADIKSDGAASSMILKSSSAGATLNKIVLPANTTADPNVIYPFNPAGWWRTISGGAFVADPGAVDAIIACQYIEVEP